MRRLRGKGLCLLAIVVGLALVGYGYGLPRTKLVVGEEPAAAEPAAGEALAVTEWGLVRGAATGTVERLADGRLRLESAQEPEGEAPT